MTVMERTPVEVQRQAALRLANEVRVAISMHRREIRDLGSDYGRLYVADLLDGTDDGIGWLEACGIAHLLRAIPKVGDKKAGYLLRRIDVRSGQRRVRDLTNRQRCLLAEALRSLRPLGKASTVRVPTPGSFEADLRAARETNS